MCYFEPAHKKTKTTTLSLKPAGFWNNFTYIYITNLNWTITNENNWCNGTGTWTDLIENMVINTSDSCIKTGIFIDINFTFIQKS
ncbi:MAG: hypothetical protein ACFFE4_18170 [Candidatus Thorarchaeota archaeon]